MVLNEQPVGKLERPIYLAFDEAEQRVQGSSGCNRFFGEVTLDFSQADQNGTVPLAFSAVGMTRMACRDDTHEMPFMQALQQTRAMRLSGSELILLDASGQALALFEADSGLAP
jgi:heat shock protein HslJ